VIIDLLAASYILYYGWCLCRPVSVFFLRCALFCYFCFFLQLCICSLQSLPTIGSQLWWSLDFLACLCCIYILSVDLFWNYIWSIDWSWRTCFFTYVRGTSLAFRKARVPSKENGKEEYLYSAFYMLCISQSAQAWITQFYLQIHHACFSFVCVHQYAPPLTEVRDI